MQYALKNDPPRRKTGAAEGFVEGRLGVGRVSFSLEEVCAETGLSPVAARFQLLRLGNKVTRVSPRQPFYLIVTPEHRVMGAPPAEWWLEDFFGWLGRPYYLALQSAAGALGSNPQALQVTQVMTDRPLREIKIGRVRIKFFVKLDTGRTPTMQLSGANSPLRISTPEATVFDLVRYADRIGGMERVAETVAPLLPRLTATRLKQVLNAENRIAVAQKLGFLLERLGEKKLAKSVFNWLPPRLQVTHLNAARGRKRPGKFSKRWGVVGDVESSVL